MNAGQPDHVCQLRLGHRKVELGPRAKAGVFHPDADFAEQMRDARRRCLASEVGNPFRKDRAVDHRIAPECKGQVGVFDELAQRLMRHEQHFRSRRRFEPPAGSWHGHRLEVAHLARDVERDRLATAVEEHVELRNQPFDHHAGMIGLLARPHDVAPRLDRRFAVGQRADRRLLLLRQDRSQLQAPQEKAERVLIGNGHCRDPCAERKARRLRQCKGPSILRAVAAMTSA